MFRPNSITEYIFCWLVDCSSTLQLPLITSLFFCHENGAFAATLSALLLDCIVLLKLKVGEILRFYNILTSLRYVNEDFQKWGKFCGFITSLTSLRYVNEDFDGLAT